MTRTMQELREARTRSTRRGGMFRGSPRLAALTLLGLGIGIGIGIGLGSGGVAATADHAGAHLPRDAGLVMATPGETEEGIPAIGPARLVPNRPHQTTDIAREGRGCAGTTPAPAPNKVLLLRAIHVGSICGMGPSCPATKLYAADNNRKSALSIVSPRNRTTGGRYDDRKANR